MHGKRQKNQRELAFPEKGEGEAQAREGRGTEPGMAEREPESPASTEHLMEEIGKPENLRKALRRVQKNKGGPGVDGMRVSELPGYLKEHGTAIRQQLLAGTYKPQPAKRVEIPKAGGGMRKLGIPTVLDRWIQQAVLQVLQERWDPTFSVHSYGFRPKRSAHQAVAQAQEYIREGYGWVVDLDLEKFFDQVNHDQLMGRVAKRVADKRLLRLIRAYLNAGVMEEGLVRASEEGTPQGGPLSPLLSNLVLNDLDRELERRGHRFVRYADDANVYVRSRRAGERVMENITRYLERRLKLRVNREKSAVDRPSRRSFLGFSVTPGKEPRRRIASKARRRMRTRVREITRRTRGVSQEQMVGELASYLRGWRAYFGFCETPSVLRDLDSWIRRRLRCAVWKQWKGGRTRYAELRKRGIGKDLAAQHAGSPQGPWRLSRSPALSFALPNAFLHSLGLPSLARL